MNKLICFLLGMVLITSCTYDVATPKLPSPPVDMEQIWSCTDAQHLDSAKLAKLLVGSWKLTYEAVDYWYPTKHNVTVTFDSLGNYTLHEDTTVTIGTWSLYPTDTYYFGVAFSKGNSYFPGLILICGDQLDSDDSYIDGPSYLFARIP